MSTGTDTSPTAASRTSERGDPGRVSHWRDLGNRLPASTGWHHSGVHVEADGTIHCAHPEGGALLSLASDGTVREVGLDLAELHGIANGGSAGILAVADPGWRMHQVGEEDYEPRTTPGRAVLLRAADGEIVLELSRPRTATYEAEEWRPTSIAVGPGGDIWVADGYGQDRVHRFSADGRHLLELHELPDGSRLDCPHAVIVRPCGAVRSEVIVADRGNHRLLVLDSEGALLHTVGAEHLDSPSGLALLDGDLYVTELHGGIARFGPDERFLGTLEDGRARSESEEAWPNRPGASPGSLRRPEMTPAVLNSPHGLASHEGSLYLTEWVIGGRLARIDAPAGS